MAQMKEQIKTPEKELNKMEISNLSDAESKTLYISTLNIMGTIFCTQSQGYENTPYLSSPDIWVREPDCLHLPYKATLPRHGIKAALPDT